MRSEPFALLLAPFLLAPFALGQGEVDTLPSVPISASAEFGETPWSTGRQGASTVVHGTAFASSGLGRFPFVASVDSTGALEWQWSGDEDDVQGLGLFVPEDGVGAYTVSFDFTWEVTVRRLDAGQSVWEAVLPGNPFGIASPFGAVMDLAGARDGSRVFGLLETFALGGLLVSFDPSDGATRWARPLPAGTEAVAFACDAPGDGLAVLLRGSLPLDNDRILLFDGATGDLRWTLPLGPIFGAGEGLAIGLDAAGTQVFVGGRPGGPGGPTLAGVDAATGSVLWSSAVGPAVVALAHDAVGPDLIAVSTHGFGAGRPIALHAVRPSLGVPQWSRTLDVAHFGGGRVRLRLDTPSQLGALAYDSSTSFVIGSDATLEVFDLVDGSAVSSVTEASPVGFSSIAGAEFQTVAGQAAVVRARGLDSGNGTDDLDLRALAVSDAGVLWSTAVDFEFAAPRAEALVALPLGDAAFATVVDTGSRRHVAKLDLAGGAVLWQSVQEETAIDFPNPAVGRALAVTTDGSLVVGARAAFSTTDEPELEALDGVSGQVLWSRSLDGLGNAWDLELVESGPSAPLLVSLHGNDGDSFGRTAMRASTLDGVEAWVAEWPPSGPGSASAAALAMVPGDDRIHGLVAAGFPSDELRILGRRLDDGALVAEVALDDEDFAPGVELGVPIAMDLAAGDGGQGLFVLSRYLGTVQLGSQLALARVDAGSGAIDWGVALDPSPLASWGPGELVLGNAAVVGVAAGASTFGAGATVVLLGLDAATGAVLWERTLGGPGEPHVFLDAAPATSGDALIVSAVAGATNRLWSFDLATGTELWSADVGGQTDLDRASWVTGVDGGVLALVGSEVAAPSGAALLERLAPAALVGGPDTISLADPAPIVLHLDRPAASAGSVHLVLGSLTGTAPSTPIGVLELPLVADAYTTLTLSSANGGPFEGTLGALAALGDARAAVQLPPGLPPTLAGLELFHAFLEFGPAGPTFASNAVGVLIAPQ